MTKILSVFAFLCALCHTSLSIAGDQDSALATVQDFYMRYLAYDHARTPTVPPPAMVLSKAFQAEISKTAAACRKYGEGSCGWSADGDAYLDTQEVGPGLSYANSGITFTEIAPGTIRVRLNVYPSLTDVGDHYLRTITFRMLKRRGNYVVDDIAYTDGVSTRKQLQAERRQLLARQPDAARKTAAPHRIGK